MVGAYTFIGAWGWGLGVLGSNPNPGRLIISASTIKLRAVSTRDTVGTLWKRPSYALG